MKYTPRKFARLIVDNELDEDDIIEFFDIVQSEVPAKLLIGHTQDGEKIQIDLVASESEGTWYYEIDLEEHLDDDEGERIVDELQDVFDFDFSFEVSTDY